MCVGRATVDVSGGWGRGAAPRLGGMSKAGVFFKAAGGVIATTVTLVTALRENPEIAKGLDGLVAKIKETTDGGTPKRRFDTKMAAINTAADAVELAFPEAAEPAGWRRQAQALRARGELVWGANEGGTRRKGMKAIDGEVTELLNQINSRLSELQRALPADDPRAS